MAKATVNEGNWFNCDGVGCCGSSNFRSRQDIIDCFHCDTCSSYKKHGLTINDKRGTKILFNRRSSYSRDTKEGKWKVTL